ncbi:MAG: hypothetical protein DMD76_18980 [Candidatus Rokuibacteriota bacterium]|nr:MAG: hypothetical protein DMD76_18980 [Candidatus Rokubacteria bacterium]
MVGVRRPRLRQITLEGEIVGVGGLVGERMAHETVAGETGELKEADRLRVPWVDHRRIPGRRARQDAAALGRLGAGREPVGIGGRGRGGRAPAARDQRARANAGRRDPHEFASVQSGGTDAAGRVGAHIGLSFSQASLEGRTGPAATASGRDIAGRRRTSQGPARGIICGWRTRMNYTRISADCHIDMPWIPTDLFTANASAAMRERMPYVTDGPDGPYWTSKNGASFGLVGGVGPSGQKLVPGQNYRVDRMAETGLYEDGKKGIRRPTDPHLRLKDMERDGVQAEVIFGILGAATRLNDHEAAIEMFRIYNDWLADFCHHYPDRQIGLACLPYGDIDAAVREIRRVAKLGLRGVEMSCSWDMEPMYHPMWEPFWQAVNEVRLPLHFHTFPSVPPQARDKLTGRTRRAALFTGVSAFQMNLINILAAVIGAAVLERYPNIRISFGESGIGWIPYALDRMDFEWEDRFRDLGLTMKPSDYWRRQCKATFQFDRIGTRMIDEMGAETLMWASDYPHTDGVWPESSKYIEEQFGHLSADVVRKITCENAGRFYGLMK